MSAPIESGAVTGAVSSADPSAVGVAQPRILVGASPLRLNVGGNAYTSSDGAAWEADSGFVGGLVSTDDVIVSGTDVDALYSARRYGSFQYQLPVASAGSYQVRLHFVDPKYAAAGQRVFSITAESVRVLNTFDIAAQVGQATALVRTINVNVSDGTLNLSFSKQVDNPILSAIEVIPPGGAPTLPSSPPASPPPASPPPPPPASPPPTSPPVSGAPVLTLMDAGSDTAIGSFNSGAVLNRAGGKTYNVVASPPSTYKSVRFMLDGKLIRIESTAPFAIGGNSATDYFAWSLALGTHTMSAVPYVNTGGTGTAGPATTVSFSVVNGTTPPPSVPPTVPPTSPPTVPPSVPPAVPPPAATYTKINWSTKKSSPIARAEALGATYNGRVYVFGGYSLTSGPVKRSDYYDPATNTWTQIADLPQLLTHVGVAQDDQNVYFVGGYVGNGKGYGQTYGSKKAWIYNFASDSYSSLPALPNYFSAGGAALIGRDLHYFGGQNIGRYDLSVHLMLNLDNPSAGWKNRTAIPHGRSHMGAVAFEGKIYTIAGQIDNDEGLVTQRWVDIYDPDTNAWSSGAMLPAAVSHIASATFVSGGRIMVMGGESSHGAQVRSVYAYNPAANTWTTLTSLPAAKFSGVAREVDGKLVFTTGGSGTATWVGTPG